MTVLSEQFGNLPEEAPMLEQPLPPMPSLQLVRLIFSPAVAFRVYDEFEREIIQQQANGYLLLAVQMPQDSWVASYLLSFGTELTVLEPESLRKKIAGHAKAIWQQHAKEPEIF
jgi:predicted DNA-binding transcriptional regulator YafY